MASMDKQKALVASSEGSAAAPDGETRRGTMRALNGTTQFSSGDFQNKKLDQNELRRIFASYDVDGSGEITVDELSVAVQEITGISASNAVVLALLGNIDMDQSGNIDEDEFVEFFGNMKDLLDMERQLTDAASRNILAETCIKVYFVVNFIAFFLFFILFLEDNFAEKEAAKKHTGLSPGTLGFIITGSSLVLVVLVSLIWPLMKLKLSPGLKRLEKNQRPMLERIATKIGLKSDAGEGHQAGTIIRPSKPSAHEETEKKLAERNWARPPPPKGPCPDEVSWRQPSKMHDEHMDIQLPPHLQVETLDTIELADEIQVGEQIGCSPWGYNRDGYIKAQAMMADAQVSPNFCVMDPQLEVRSPMARSKRLRPIPFDGMKGPRWAQPALPPDVDGMDLPHWRASLATPPTVSEEPLR